MKRFYFLPLALNLALGGLADAEQQRAAVPSNLRIEVQIVAIPEQIGFPLIKELKKKDQIEAANEKMQGLLEQGVAKLIGWPIIVTQSGQRAVIEAIQEIRYATEFVPPAVGFTPDVPMDGKEKKIKIAPVADITTFGEAPTAFETRNAGVTFEVEATLGPDGKTIEMNIVPQHVRLNGFNKVTVEGGGHNGKVIVEQPEFHTNKITTTITIQSGQRMLLGVYPTTDPPKHLEFFILKAEVLPVE